MGRIKKLDTEGMLGRVNKQKLDDCYWEDFLEADQCLVEIDRLIAECGVEGITPVGYTSYGDKIRMLQEDCHLLKEYPQEAAQSIYNSIPGILGASGAVYGVLVGFAMLYPHARLTLIFPPITLDAKWWVLIFVGIELFTGISGTMMGIAHFAHLGGALFGWLLIRYWRKKRVIY